MDFACWIFLSPHLDDVALSCGGLVWDLAQNGHTVEVWTLMAGDPPDEDYFLFAQQNHQDWGLSGREVLATRRAEDRTACELLGARPRHFDWPDAIYRRDPNTGNALVNNNVELFSKPPEGWLVDEIAHLLKKDVPPGAALIAPMGLGTHIDHQAVVKAVDSTGLAGDVYPDYPYVLKDFNWPDMQQKKLQVVPQPLGEPALQAWQDAVLCYRSQIGQFWRDEEEARLCLRNYLAGGGGRLWQEPVS